MGEVQYAKHVKLEQVEDGEEYQRLWQQLADESHMGIASGQHHPFARASELEFGTNRVGGDEEDEKHQHARHHYGTEIDVVIGPRIAYHVQVYGDGLEKGFYLVGCFAEHREFGHAYGG